ncbi:hypothetical protein CDAR_439011 [Caerostris darwini]|uniref:Uncharacterized protein n=1 Tax=Caerostris darwini TaxID=1538125 RepID=A0AAV4MJ74_9ARAC|nr:hypothetical protein CDAR_439011 [Caerostris darwini]
MVNSFPSARVHILDRRAFANGFQSADTNSRNISPHYSRIRFTPFVSSRIHCPVFGIIKPDSQKRRLYGDVLFVQDSRQLTQLPMKTALKMGA